MRLRLIYRERVGVITLYILYKKIDIRPQKVQNNVPFEVNLRLLLLVFVTNNRKKQIKLYETFTAIEAIQIDKR